MTHRTGQIIITLIVAIMTVGLPVLILIQLGNGTLELQNVKTGLIWLPCLIGLLTCILMTSQIKPKKG